MPALTLRGLVRTIASLQTLLGQLAAGSSTASTPTDPAFQAVLGQVQQTSDHINQSLLRLDGKISDLNGPSQRAVLWLNWLSTPENLALHLQTLTAAARLAAQLQKAGKRTLPLQTSLYNISSLVYSRPTPAGKMELVLHEGFSGAPEEILQALVKVALVRKNASDLLQIRQYARGPAFQAIQQGLEVTPTVTRRQAQAQGQHYHLDEIFLRVNQAYFSNQISRPNLQWSSTRTRRKFGHYDFKTDTVMLSRSLDDPKVPAYVLDAVMHHELLHKHLGIKVVNGRRYTHTAQFRAAERQFPHYAQAEAFLKKMAAAGRTLQVLSRKS